MKSHLKNVVGIASLQEQAVKPLPLGCGGCQRSSFVISINEFCVEPLTEEFLKIKKVYKNIKVLLEKFKDDEKLITYYKVLINISDINKFFLDDLTYLSSKNNFELNKEKVISIISK